MTEYIVKSAVLSCVLYFCYLIIFRKSRNYHLNRIVLLFSVLFSLIVPLINIAIAETRTQEFGKNDLFVSALSGINEMSDSAIESSRGIDNFVSTSDIFILIYLVISVFLLVRFCINLYSIVTSRHSSESIIHNGEKISLLNKQINPFSFFRTIYISKDTYMKDKIDNDILLHETAHARQLHSIDTLFMEIIQVVYWLNPFIYLFKKLIKSNHEYLADEFVLKSGSDKIDYSNKLINYTNQNKTLNLASGFDYSLIKNRLVMLSKFEQKSRITYKLALVIPIFAVLFITTAFSSAKDSNIDVNNSKEQGIIYADELFWSGENHQVYLKGKVQVKHGENNFQGEGTFSNFGEVHLLVINGKPATLNSSVTLSGIKCEVVTLTKKEAVKKYGSDGRFGALQIKALK